ncbi:hypothetical protein ACFE04_011526 [Oxalis oulophora]
MSLHRSILKRISLHNHHRSFSSAAAALAPIEDPFSAPLTYLDGFPRPDPKYAETILAIPRAESGTKIAVRERKAGRVPAILFEQEDGQHGGNKRLVSVETNQIRKLVNHLGRSFFLSRAFQLEVRPEFGSGDLIEKVRVLPRKIHLHSSTDAPLNVTFIRAPSTALLKVDVPLVFIGEDISPGLRKGASLNTIKRTVKFLCPADIIPPYIDVDLRRCMTYCNVVDVFEAFEGHFWFAVFGKIFESAYTVTLSRILSLFSNHCIFLLHGLSSTVVVSKPPRGDSVGLTFELIVVSKPPQGHFARFGVKIGWPLAHKNLSGRRDPISLQPSSQNRHIGSATSPSQSHHIEML